MISAASDRPEKPKLSAAAPANLRKLRRPRSDEWSAEWLPHSVHIGIGGLRGDAMVYRYEYQATINIVETC